MKFKVFISVFLILSVVLFSEGIVIKDLLGREVEVPSNVNRIVAVGPGALRLIAYLKATDMVVGVEDFEKLRPSGRPYILAYPELKELPSVGPGGPGKLPDLESLIALQPDVVFITYVDRKTAQDIQEKTGIPVVVLSYGNLGTFEDEDLFRSIELAGKILGREEKAHEVVDFIKKAQEDLTVSKALPSTLVESDTKELMESIARRRSILLSWSYKQGTLWTSWEKDTNS